MAQASIFQRVSAVYSYIRLFFRIKLAIALYRIAKVIGDAADTILDQEEAGLRRKGYLKR